MWCEKSMSQIAFEMKIGPKETPVKFQFDRYALGWSGGYKIPSIYNGQPRNIGREVFYDSLGEAVEKTLIEAGHALHRLLPIKGLV